MFTHIHTYIKFYRNSPFNTFIQ